MTIEKIKRIIKYTIFVLIVIEVVLVILFIIFGFKKETKLKLTEEHIERVSLLQQCMKAYGVKIIPQLKEKKFDSSQVINNTVLSELTIKFNGKKGETTQIFKQAE